MPACELPFNVGKDVAGRGEGFQRQEFSSRFFDEAANVGPGERSGEVRQLPKPGQETLRRAAIDGDQPVSFHEKHSALLYSARFFWRFHGK